MEMWQNDNIQNQDKQNLWAHLACHFFLTSKINENFIVFTGQSRSELIVLQQLLLKTGSLVWGDKQVKIECRNGHCVFAVEKL